MASIVMQLLLLHATNQHIRITQLSWPMQIDVIATALTIKLKHWWNDCIQQSHALHDLQMQYSYRYT